MGTLPDVNAHSQPGEQVDLTHKGLGRRGSFSTRGGRRPPSWALTQSTPPKCALRPLRAGLKRSCDYFWTEAMFVTPG